MSETQTGLLFMSIGVVIMAFVYGFRFSKRKFGNYKLSNAVLIMVIPLYYIGTMMFEPEGINMVPPQSFPHLTYALACIGLAFGATMLVALFWALIVIIFDGFVKRYHAKHFSKHTA